MKRISLPGLIYSTLLFATVLSCNDHQSPDPVPVKQRIKTLTQILPGINGETFVSNFTYNSQNQLEYIYSLPSPASISGNTATTHFIFDENKNISQVHRSFNNGASEESYQYTIGSFGQLTKINYDGGGNDQYNMSFSFNGQQLNESNRRFTFSSVSYLQTIIYHFTGTNLNSADYTSTLTRNVPTTSSSTLIFTYDDKINPFFGMPVIPAPNQGTKPTSGNFNYYTFSGGLDNLVYLSRNNIVSEKSSSLSEKTYEYTYNSDGLPLTRISKRKNTPQDSPFVEETLVFEYETY